MGKQKKVFVEVKDTDLFNGHLQVQSWEKKQCLFPFWEIDKRPKHCNAIIAQVSINRTKGTISSLADYT